MDNKIQHSLNDLIEIARDGGDFYTEAAGKVKDSELSALFSQMASHKRDIVAGLSASVAAAGGKPAEHGTMVGTMRQAYGKVRAALGDADYAYVAELEDTEDRLLAAWEHFASLGLGQRESVRQGIDSLSEGVFSAVGEELQERQHDGLIIRYGHDGVPLFLQDLLGQHGVQRKPRCLRLPLIFTDSGSC